MSEPSTRSAEKPGYETEDVAVGRTWLVIAGLALSVALTIAGLIWLQAHFRQAQRAGLPPLTRQQAKPLEPPKPNLQADPYADLDRDRAAAQKQLESYGYLDEGRTRARIPIDRAMALTVGKPLDP